MATHNNYMPVIEEIKKSKSSQYVLNNDKMKRITNSEIPKSMFNRNYITSRRNELARYIMDEAESFEIISPKIIIYKKNCKEVK